MTGGFKWLLNKSNITITQGNSTYVINGGSVTIMNDFHGDSEDTDLR
jgi:hypothetical protein